MNICIFGDSIAWGADDPEQGGWANRLWNYLETKDKAIGISNLSISGDTTSNLLNRLEVELKSREPDIVIFAIGINDTQSMNSMNTPQISIDKFKNNLKELYTTAKKFADKIVFVGLTPVDESKTNPVSWGIDISYTNINIKNFNGAINKFCEKNNVTFISMDGIIDTADLDDGLHPNTKGHKKMFDKIKPEIEDLLRSNK